MKTVTSTDRSLAIARSSARRILSSLVVCAALGAAASSLLAQAPADGSGGGRRRTDSGGGRGNFDPQEMQARMLNAVRERLEITDDEEWKVISARIAKVNELRRSAGGGFGGFIGRGPGGPGGPGGGGGDTGRGPRGGGGNNPELAALSTALRDKLPDAEIKSRLERVREKRRESEASLAKAQEELRAVLSVRQEAVAVVFGLLP